MEKTFYTRILLKRDTSANWTTYNPVLKNGEMILVDTADGELRMKVGDGTKTYTQLPFTDEALRNRMAEYVKTEEVDAIVAAAVARLNIGFAAGEDDMLPTDNYYSDLNEELETLLDGDE